MVLLLALLLMGRNTTTLFEKAVADPQLREEFVARIIEQYPPPPQVKLLQYATSEVLEELRLQGYVPKHDAVMSTISLEKNVEVSEIGSQEWPVRIVVLSTMFDFSSARNERDVIASLLHEYDHVKQFNQTDVAGFSYNKDFLVVDGEYEGQHHLELVNIIHELDAYQTQIHRITSSDWGSSEFYIDRRHKIYIEQYLRLLDYFENGPPVHAQVVKRAKIEFFAPWFPRTVAFSLTPDGTPKFTDLKTGKSFILPKEVLFPEKSQ